MSTYTAVVEFIDVREITIDADSLKEAEAKYEAGDWASEDTTNFYPNRKMKPMSLTKVKPT